MKLDKDIISDVLIFLLLMFCVGCCTSLVHHSIDAQESKNVILNDTIK